MSDAALVLEVNNRALVDLLGSWGAWTVTVGGQRRIPYNRSSLKGETMDKSKLSESAVVTEFGILEGMDVARVRRLSDITVNERGCLQWGTMVVLKLVAYMGNVGFVTTSEGSHE